MHIIFPTTANPEGLAVSSFYGDGWSNFRAVGGGGAKWRLEDEPMDFKCGEQVFKAAAVVAQMDPADETSSKAELLRQVLENVMTATTPKECKFAVFKIPEDMFDSGAWDDGAAEYAMYETQKWKCMSPDFHAMMKRAGKEAEYYGVERLYFVEAAGTDDLRWGCGLTVDDFHAAVTANVECPDWLCMKSGSPFPGKNLLGEALTLASKVVLGERFEYLNETVEEYVARIGTTCPLFALAPSVAVFQPMVCDAVGMESGRDFPVLGETGACRTLSDAPVAECGRTLSDAPVAECGRTLSDAPVAECGRTLSDAPVAECGRTLSDAPVAECGRTLSDAPVAECGRTLSGAEEYGEIGPCCRTTSLAEEKSPKRLREEDCDA
jgi:hypothetical protein